MYTETTIQYQGERVAIVLEGARNITFFGKIIDINEIEHIITLENDRGHVTIQTRQIAAISPYYPAKVSIGSDEELEELSRKPEEETKELKAWEMVYWQVIDYLKKDGVATTTEILVRTGVSNPTALAGMKKVVENFPKDVTIASRRPLSIALISHDETNWTKYFIKATEKAGSLI